MQKTKIPWCTHVWNPIKGCAHVSRGCHNCYAERLAGRFGGEGQVFEGLVQYRSKASGLVYKNRKAAGSCKAEWNGVVDCDIVRIPNTGFPKKPSIIFVNSMGDIFYEKVKFDHIDIVLNMIEWMNEHVFIILTKRPQRAFEYEEYFRTIEDDYNTTVWPDNLILGISAEDQETFHDRMEWLNKLSCKNKMVSLEPMLGPIDMSHWIGPDSECAHYANNPTEQEMSNGVVDCYRTENVCGLCKPSYCVFCNLISPWVICGAETGPNKRPMNIEWARNIRDQCKHASVPFFFKQDSQKNKTLDGVEYKEYPKIIMDKIFKK